MHTHTYTHAHIHTHTHTQVESALDIAKDQSKDNGTALVLQHTDYLDEFLNDSIALVLYMSHGTHVNHRQTRRHNIGTSADTHTHANTQTRRHNIGTHTGGREREREAHTQESAGKCKVHSTLQHTNKQIKAQNLFCWKQM